MRQLPEPTTGDFVGAALHRALIDVDYNALPGILKFNGVEIYVEPGDKLHSLLAYYELTNEQLMRKARAR